MNNHGEEGTCARILVVDDSRSIREFVVGLLCEAGYAVDSAEDGAQALELFARHEPDVILLDVEMPGMTGMEVLDRLTGGSHLFSVIMFTTHFESEWIVDAFSRGADDYVKKPFNADELLARIRSAVRSVLLKRRLSLTTRQAEDALARLREAQVQLIEEKKLQAVSRLAAGLAHEINNPLGFIKSNLATFGHYAEYLISLCSSVSDTAAPADSPADRRRLCRIKEDLPLLLQETIQGVERIGSIVRLFWELEQTIAPREVHVEDLNAVVREVTSAVAANLPPGVVLVPELEGNALPVVGKRSMLNTLLQNLLINAVEATGAGGVIAVKTFFQGNTVVCEIHDDGPGIPDETVPLIFEPFFTTKTGTPHFGLGLTIADCFARAHGGSIGVLSQPGTGTVITIFLPLSVAHRNHDG